MTEMMQAGEADPACCPGSAATSVPRRAADISRAAVSTKCRWLALRRAKIVSKRGTK
jgi:hypothetical protein